ncbi:MAG: PhoH family protein [Desulfobacterium sp.]|jgi:phosphate starvation-inducible PhoH-like protein|nr:PhoH family protein [Desulfobacterium sp.]
MKRIILAENDLARELCGPYNANITTLADTTGIKIDVRGNELALRGKESDVLLAENIIDQLYGLVKKRYTLTPLDIESAARALRLDSTCKLATIFLDTIFTTVKKRPITPRNPAQKLYVDAARKNDIVFSIGPAGTGKTYLAMAMAVAAFTRGEVNRIVLTRPAVEAGEALGFLPGDLAEKINPYLRPLYDALYDMLPFDRVRELIEQGTIEIAPLAFMRGRTLNNSFIILDEAQNTSSEQMKMFLTRIGYSSRAVITGDITQIDLPRGKGSGLIEAKSILQDIDGLAFVYFTREDVVRHRLVSSIIHAYERSYERSIKTDDTLKNGS